MNKQYIAFRYFYLGALILLCASMGFASTTPSLATSKVQVASPIPTMLPYPDTDSQNATTRADMMEIAERYWSYKWRAVNSNATIWEWVPPEPNEEEGKWVVVNRDSDEKYNDMHHQNNVDTPDIDWCTGDGNKDPWGCWKYAADNYGIPYYWGGKTAIRNDSLNDSKPELYLAPIDGRATNDRQYFDQRLQVGYPAGDVVGNSGAGYPYGAGVDCTGFVIQDWRMGFSATPEKLVKMSRPILFSDLRAGDIVYQPWGEEAHAIIFKEWITPGQIFEAYEAAESLGKVVKSQYQLVGKPGALEEDIWYGGEGSGVPLGLSTTQKVNIRRVKACTPNPENPEEESCLLESAVGQTIFEAHPRTYFTPIDVEIVIDSSGSMDEQRLESAKAAAKTIVDFLRPGDKVGIVSYGGDSIVNQTLTMVTNENKNYLKDTVIGDHIRSRWDGSNPVTGLTDAMWDLEWNAYYVPFNPFNDSSIPDRLRDPVRIIILISDGEETVGPALTDGFLFNLHSMHIPVYTLQTAYRGSTVGSDNFERTQLLKHVAIMTDGKYAKSIIEIIDNLQTKILSGQIVDSTRYDSYISPTMMTAQDSWLVDSSMGKMNVTVFWEGDTPMHLSLEKPDESMINATSVVPKVSILAGDGFISYIVESPELGEWTWHLSGIQNQRYHLMVMTNSGIIPNIDPNKMEYGLKEPIQIVASIDNNDLLVRGVTADATVNYPDPKHPISTFALYDDGRHNDGAADDGIYGGSFNDASTQGLYSFNVKISHNSNEPGESFIRERNFSVLVVDAPRVISIVPATPSDTNYSLVDYTVTFSDYIGPAGLDVSDFALTTEGITGAKVVSVRSDYDTINDIQTATVTVNTGTGNGKIRLDVVDDDTIKNVDDVRLGTLGIGNGNFTAGEAYIIDRSTRSTVVTKLEDSNDGVCDTDCSLREAILASARGDTITFDLSLSGGTVHLNNPLMLFSDIAIDGTALPIPVIISGNTDDYDLRDVQAFRVNPDVTAVLNGLTISNSYARYGGAIDSSGALTIINSTISHNSASYDGGAINSNGQLTIINSTISDNSAWMGGSIYHTGALTITNSTFSGNSASYDYGAVYSNGALTITNSTFSNNSAREVGGIFNFNGPLNYANTIIANSSGADCALFYSSIGTNTVNIVEDGSCSAALSGDPQLDVLADNGGRSQTIGLLVGSPAIDVGDDAVCAAAPVNNLDQRGVVRPQGAQCDIGAYEAEPDDGAPQVSSIAIANTTASSVDFTVTFSEYVTGVDIGDFTLTTTDVSEAAIISLNGSGRIYTVSINFGIGDGRIRLDVLNDGTIMDLTSHPLFAAFRDGGTYTIRKVVNKLADTDDGFCDTDCSLREALAVAPSGDTIAFDAALSGKIIHLQSTLVLSKNITINGSSLIEPVIISGDTNNDGTCDVRVFRIVQGVSANLQRLAISSGYHPNGGGGIFNEGTLSVTDTLISNNSSNSSGGGILNRSTLTVLNSWFTDNHSSTGGGIHNTGTLMVTATTFSNNSAGSGGAILNWATLDITNSTFLSNSATNSGGGIINGYSSTLVVSNSIFQGNSAAYGGGIYNLAAYVLPHSTVDVINSTFSDNSSAQQGGALYNEDMLEISNSTIAGNSATFGGGIFNRYLLTMNHNTISGNHSSFSGGGIYSSTDGRVYYYNTIIANSTAGGDCASHGYITGAWNKNLVEDGSCAVALTGDPLLGVLADNGGPTQTMSLLPGSPAINVGDDARCAASPVNNLDQRGIIRPQDSHCDLGAFEAMDENPPTVSEIKIANVANAQPGSMDFTVTFSEPVTGVDVSDFTLTTTDAPGVTISNVSGSGSIYTVSVQVGSGDGTIRLDVVDDDTIADLASHPLNGGFTGGETYWIAKVVSKLTDTSDGLCDADCSLREAITAAAPGDTITFDTALSGGTIHLASTLSLSRDIIIDGSALAIPIIISGDTNNDGTGDVRVFYVNSGVIATLNGLTVSQGRDFDKGGGVFNEGHLTITNTTFSHNSAYSGGSIYSTGSLTITRSVFQEDGALSGGGIFNKGRLIITNTIFSHNSASSGGSIYSTGSLTITSSTFSDNSSGSGASIYSTGDGLTITNSTFSGNRSGSAAVYSVGDELAITNSAFSSNLSSGVYNQGTLTITNSTFSDNSNGSGSGVYNQGTLTIANSTFFGNSGGNGTGAHNTGTLTVINSTFASNYVGGDGGGVIYNDGGLLNYANNIIANSTFATSGSECVNVNGGTIGTNIANLIEDGSCSAALRGDPHLGVLANNGGPTQTMMLLPGSPAIDAGNDVVCAAAPVNNLDQRGIVRPQGLHCDIGAYERIIPVVLSSVRADTNPTSAPSLRFTVTFSESVTGVDASDFSLTTTNIAGATITGVSGSGATRTITINKGIVGSVNATIRLDILDDDSIRDASNIPLGDLGVGNGNFGDGESYTIAANVTRPTMLFPHNDYVTNNTMPTFTWGTVTDASRYEVMVATDSTFTQNVNSYSIEEPTFTFSSPLTDSRYYWRVRAYNIVNEPGGWSTLRDFTIDTVPPSPPILSSPANGVTIRSVPTCRWKSVSGAVLYQFQLDNDPDFSTPLFSVEPRTVNWKPGGGLRGTYYWRTRAKDSAGNWGDWSQVFTFTVVSPR